MRRIAAELCVASLACAIGCAGQGSSGSGGEASVVWFEEVARARGLDFTHRSGHVERYLIPEIMGGGAALVDVDGDGDLDAYLVQSGSLQQDSAVDSMNRLLVNDGNGRFTDETERSAAGHDGYGMGVAVGDYDNDGDNDLYVTNLGPNVLLANDGNGQFHDVTSTAGVGDPGWSTGAVFLDHDADGDLDLFVANYVNWSPQTEQDCHDARFQQDFCGPSAYEAPAMDRLYRNDGDGSFTDVTLAAGLDAAFGNGLGVVSGDFDGNGRPDLFVANDATLNQLWLNQDGVRFVDEALLRGSAIDEQGRAKAGMGVDAVDLHGDGMESLLVVNLQDETDSFYRNTGGFFVDATAAVGLAGASRRYTRFGVGFVDFDNDGFLDLFEANGGVLRSPEARADDRYAEPNLVFRNDGTPRFHEIARGGLATELIATSRAAVFGDVDNDGGVDVLVVNRDGPTHLLRNVVSDRGHWIRMRVVDEHGRDALGARVSMQVGERIRSRTVRSAYSYLAASDPRVHVGLGAETGVRDVRVVWSDDTSESYGAFEGDREVVLRRGDSGAVGRPGG